MKLPDGLEGAVVTTESNLFYLTGYPNADAAIALTPDKKYYITDKRCSEEADKLIKGFEIVDSGGIGYVEKAAQILRESGAINVGAELDEISYRDYLKISACFSGISSVSEFISGLRAVKNEEELGKIRLAQEITDKVYDKVLEFVSPGMTEKTLKSFIDTEIVRRGGYPAFDTIVAFGENTSKPHCHAGERTLKRGDAVTIDFGAKLMGYCSDMTRSFCVGFLPDEYAEIYNAVLNAKNLAQKTIKAGMSGKNCDFVAREYFEKLGISEYFIHSLGHSLGVDIHESPNLSPREERVIPEGAVTSVEPGIYIPNKFGVRIENIVLFKNSGVENLTNSPENLIIV